MLKSLMTYVNGLLLALLILALSSRSSGNLISDDPINFVPDGHYVIAKIVFLSYYRFKSMLFLEHSSPLKLFLDKYSSSQSLFELYKC